MDELQALLDEQEADRELADTHARWLFNLTFILFCISILQSYSILTIDNSFFSLLFSTIAVASIVFSRHCLLFLTIIIIVPKCFTQQLLKVWGIWRFSPCVNIYDPPSIRSGGSVKKVLYNSVYISTIFSILIYTFIPL